MEIKGTIHHIISSAAFATLVALLLEQNMSGTWHEGLYQIGPITQMHHTTAQLCNFATALLYKYKKCATTHQHNSTNVQLHTCSAVYLHDWATVQLYKNVGHIG